MNKAPEGTYPVRQFWNRQIVSKKLWDEEEWLVDYLLESVEKTVEKHKDFVMITKKPILHRKVFTASISDINEDLLMFLDDFPIPEEEAEYVVLDFFTYAAVNGDK
jgi:ATP/maltotriose-dependent transcriptional regulator MalT